MANIWEKDILILAGNLNSGCTSCSAHRTTNFTNPEFQFPEFKVLQSVFIFLKKIVLLAFLVVLYDINLKILPCRNIQKVNNKKFVVKIRDSYWLFEWAERDKTQNFSLSYKLDQFLVALVAVA